ncbi:hypothetical protein [Pseudofulvibacter geojedonensis]|uniref:Late embryogenesis abundant protein LEA-2 subgroup domain-containing protein n=1 Tax=Pseudofulvibacter geojedonensis TaxID=1123758 RepID=A0ABW3HZB1_9FLAO
MKQTIAFLILFLSLNSCIKRNIEYQKLENIKIISVDSNEITLSADAIFKNPNILGGKVFPEDLKVFIGEEEITSVKSRDFKVPAVKEFSVPLEATIPFNKIPGYKKGGILGVIMGSLSKTHKVSFKGILNYRVAGFKSIYKIDHTEELKLEL